MGSTEGLMEVKPRMTSSSASLGSKDMTSAASLYEQLSSSCNQENLDNLSMRAMYDMDSEGDSISRPLSRGSVTSGVSMMATKDGVDGERVKRLGIPQYPLNLLNSMAHTQYKKVHGSTAYSRGGSNSSSSISRTQLSQATADSPNSPPMTLREKMKLLGNEVNSNDVIDETLLCDESAMEKYRNAPNNSFHVPESNAMSEIDSNSSTMGDDTSFQNLSNLSPVVGTMYGERDSSS